MSTCITCGTRLRSVDGVCPACVARSITAFLRSPSPPPEGDEGELVPGYELHEIIGRGGMGVVHRATRLADHTDIAIKLLPEHLTDREDIAERFAREAHALEALNHPHILRVLDSGETPCGRLFLVTEFAAGGDLARRLQQGPLDTETALRMFRDILGAIAEAHRQGIAHRDIKPANILLDANDAVRVADFSLAKLLPHGEAPMLTVTQSNDVFGTPYYIAPEVRRGASFVDHRADIFSLGVLLHEMLTGRLPIGNFEPASQLTKAPPEVDALISNCLREDPAKRPATVEQIERDLAQALAAPRRWREAWIMGGISVAILAALTFPLWRSAAPGSPKPSLAPIPTASRAMGKPWVNSLGMPFVVLPNTSLQFCQWETRRADFGVFATASNGADNDSRALWRRPLRKVTANDPVTPVSFLQAQRFCEWLTAKEHQEGVLSAALRYRLPTDAEWSLAAGLHQEIGATPDERRQHSVPADLALYAWGHAIKPPKNAFPANLAGQEVSPNGLFHTDPWVFTAPVGSFPANANGLYDMSGNVAEWCDSPWSASNADKVLRGGSWNDSSPASLRLDYRIPAHEKDEPVGAGFRVVIAAE